jgi:hypothetical protein
MDVKIDDASSAPLAQSDLVATQAPVIHKEKEEEEELASRHDGTRGVRSSVVAGSS